MWVKRGKIFAAVYKEIFQKTSENTNKKVGYEDLLPTQEPQGWIRIGEEMGNTTKKGNASDH